MKHRRQIFAFLLATALLTVPCIGVSAADGYAYTVRILPGAQGSIGGTNSFDVSYGERMSFNPASVTVSDDSKYYVKGIREAGKDEAINNPSFIVDKDVDYVVAYGILGDAVAYTVNYLDEAGNALAESQTFYGNVGDKPIAAYTYVEGYQPQYYNLTKTLSANAAENIFDFIYTPVEAGTAAAEEAEAEAAAAAGAAAGAAPAAAVVAPAAGAAPAGDAAAGDADADDADLQEAADVDTPMELQDLDDPDTPTGNVTLDADESAGSNMGVIIGIIVAAAVTAAGLIAWRIVGRRKKKQGNDTADKK